MTAHKARTDQSSAIRAWFATNYSVPAMIVAVVGVLASAWGLVVAVGDPDGENPVSWLMFLGPAAAGGFPTLELAWSRDRDLSTASIKRRWFRLPILGALAALAAMGVAEIVMNATGAVAAAQAEDQWHYWFPTDGPSPASVMFALLGWVIALLFSLTFFMLVLWPLQLVLRPRQAIGENMMDTSEPNLRRNRAALALTLLLVIDAFVISVALALEIDWLAVAGVVIGVVMLVVVVLLQRVDKQRRAEAGLPAGVEIRRKRKRDHY
ncbi:hypothetical protein [Glycomyces harbinensis]|uniref:Uncharacterized protein n=1 Tax=Glycomyces harbinensis TaxID=58114 RepID=A0A1G6ZJ39_9ACTN|nr:hypothetical protein [Glycomyces harbinensis]SDE02521.1 hypothetical protein SAMN05216270_11132 [Glycomyces harbinensis]